MQRYAAPQQPIQPLKWTVSIMRLPRIYAFDSCINLKKISLPSTLKLLSDRAFYGDTALREVYNYAATPLEISSTFDDSVDNMKDITLYVPAGSKAAYEAASVWNEMTIVEMTKTPTGLKTAQSDKIQSTKTLRNGLIIIRKADKYYSIDGTQIR